MAKYTLLVLANPTAGKEAEFNRWYNEQHIPDLLRIPGFVGVQRSCLTGSQIHPHAQPYKYLALWDIETDDLAGVLKEINARRGTPDMVESESIDVGNALACVMEPVTPKFTAQDVAHSRRSA